MAGADLNPHIRRRGSPLDALIAQAIRRYGEFTPSSMEGDVAQLFLEFANEIVDDHLEHPYWPEGEEVPYYLSVNEARPQIEDGVMVAGLVARYALQQGSPSVEMHLPMYQRLLNRRLWHAISGSGRIQMRPMDKKKGSSPITGMPERGDRK